MRPRATAAPYVAGPLWRAAAFGLLLTHRPVQIAKLLLDRGAAVNAQDHTGASPLHRYGVAVYLPVRRDGRLVDSSIRATGIGG